MLSPAHWAEFDCPAILLSIGAKFVLHRGNFGQHGLIYLIPTYRTSRFRCAGSELGEVVLVLTREGARQVAAALSAFRSDMCWAARAAPVGHTKLGTCQVGWGGAEAQAPQSCNITECLLQIARLALSDVLLRSQC